MEKAKVYFTREITPDSLIRIYHALGRELKGKVAVKISTGVNIPVWRSHAFR